MLIIAGLQSKTFHWLKNQPSGTWGSKKFKYPSLLLGTLKTLQRIIPEPKVTRMVRISHQTGQDSQLDGQDSQLDGQDS